MISGIMLRNLRRYSVFPVIPDTVNRILPTFQENEQSMRRVVDEMSASLEKIRQGIIHSLKTYCF